MEAEYQIVGTLLQYPDAIRHVTDLHPHHFFDRNIAKIYGCVLEKIQGGIPFTAVTLAQEMGEKYKPYVAACVGYSTLAPHAIADSIIEASHRARLVISAKEQLRLAKEGRSSQEIAAVAREAVDGTVYGPSAFQTGLQVGEELLKDIETQKKPISTGIKSLDECMGGGMYAGFTYGLGGRKKTGKTTMAGTLSFNMNLAGTKHLYIAAEMGAKQIHQRSMARHLEIYPSAFRTGYIGHESAKSRLAEAVTKLPDNVIYCNAPGITFAKLKQVYVAAKLKYNIEVAIIDYWQLIGGAGKAGVTSHLDEVAQWIADAGRRHDVANLLLSQINQEGNTRGGEGIKNACDQFYQLHRPNNKGNGYWMEMQDTRYTAYQDIGSEDNCTLSLNERGPFFEEQNL